MNILTTLVLLSLLGALHGSSAFKFFQEDLNLSKLNRTIYVPMVPMFTPSELRPSGWFRRTVSRLGRLFRRFTDNYSQFSDLLYFGTMPTQFSTIQGLVTGHGVKNVINLLAPNEYGNLASLYDQFGLNELRLPTPDHQEPPLEYIEAALEFIQQNALNNEPTYIHSLRGTFRSAEIIYALITQQHGDWSPLQRQSYLNKLRPGVLSNIFQWPNMIKFASLIGAAI